MSSASIDIPAKVDYIFPPGDFEDQRTVRGKLKGQFGVATVELSRRSMALGDEGVRSTIERSAAGYDDYDLGNTDGVIEMPPDDTKWYRLGHNDVTRIAWKMHSFQALPEPKAGPQCTNEGYSVEVTRDGQVRVVHTDYFPQAEPGDRKTKTDLSSGLKKPKISSMPGESEPKSISFNDNVEHAVFLDHPDFDFPFIFQDSDGSYSIATYSKRTEVATLPRGLQISTVGKPAFIGTIQPPCDVKQYTTVDPPHSCSTVYRLPDRNITLGWKVESCEPAEGERAPSIAGRRQLITEHTPAGIRSRFLISSPEKASASEKSEKHPGKFGQLGTGAARESEAKPPGAVYQAFFDAHLNRGGRKDPCIWTKPETWTQ